MAMTIVGLNSWFARSTEQIKLYLDKWN